MEMKEKIMQRILEELECKAITFSEFIDEIA
jgi:hypothetical protein